MDLISAKIVILLTLLFDGLFFGHLSLMIKVWMEKRKKHHEGEQSKSEVVAFLNCFAAGIFFATCMLHMLPEVSEKMKEIFEINYPIAECVAAIGFFFVLTLEQLVTACCLSKSHHGKQNIDGNTDQTDISGISVNIVSNEHVADSTRSPANGAVQLRVEAQDGLAVKTDSVDNEENHMHFDPKTQSVMRILILVAALSLHAIFEGLFFGLSRGSPRELLGTIAAVLIHKSIIAFSTGMQLLTSEIPKKFLCTAICIFSFMAPVGVLIGIIITNIGDGVESEGAIVILEAIATGTFLYVTFLELVPHEFIGDVKNGPLKVLCMASGFTTMAIFQALSPEEGELEQVMLPVNNTGDN